MFLVLDWLFPQTIETFQSRFNGEIRVVKSFGKLSVVVGGYQQSGSMIERVWRKALDKIPDPLNQLQIREILVLGLGSGTIVNLLTKKWPRSRILGIEIDPVMVEIGKKYFALNSNLQLKIEISDGFKSINQFIASKRRFGLIILDIYKGNVMDERMNLGFIEKCKNLLEKDGLLVVNLLVFGPKADREKEFLDQVQSKFETRAVKVDYNRFLFISRQGDPSH